MNLLAEEQLFKRLVWAFNINLIKISASHSYIFSKYGSTEAEMSNSHRKAYLSIVS